MTKHILRPAIGTVLLLLVPLIAMQFTDEVNWNMTDFVVMGVMLFVVGLLLELALHKLTTRRVIIAALVVFAFLWLWAELAVGVFTNWGS